MNKVHVGRMTAYVIVVRSVVHVGVPVEHKHWTYWFYSQTRKEAIYHNVVEISDHCQPEFFDDIQFGANAMQ